MSRGAAHVFGAGITTDDILPGRYLDRSNDEAGAFAMAGVDPDFAARVRPGDYVVAGHDFGQGSGRESAVYALSRAGVAGVIAPSFARVFFRNAINIGLPPIVVDSIDGIATGDELDVDLDARTVTNATHGVVYPIRNLTGISRDILRAGGIVALTRARIARQREEERR